MSADRFEVNLRELLRSEAATAPVTMDLATLQARAGRRSRWPWAAWPRAARMATLGGGVAAIALAVALGVSRGTQPPDVGASPSAPASPVASPSRPAGPSSSPSPSSAAIDFGPSGTIVVARIASSTVTFVVVDPVAIQTEASGTVERVLGQVAVGPLSPERHLEPDAVQAISPTGDVLLTLSSGDAETLVTTNVLVRLGETVSLDRAVPGGQGSFASDGTLVIVGSLLGGAPAVVVVDAANPTGRLISVPAGVSPSGPRPIFTSDSAGIVATREAGADGTELEYVILGLDGSIRPLVVGEPLSLVRGTERPLGANGERVGGGCDTVAGAGGGCVVIVLPAGATTPDGTNITPAGQECCQSQMWTPDGKQVVMLTSPGNQIWTWDGTGSRRITTLSSDLAQRSPTIAGYSTGTGTAFVILDASDAGTIIQRMDRDQSIGIAGTVVAVVP